MKKLLSLLKKSSFLVFPFTLIITIFYIGWWIGHPNEPKEKDLSSEVESWWTCSMHPQIKQPNKGLCPICNMELIPMKGDSNSEPRTISVSEQSANALGIRISPVIRRPVSREIKLVGNIVPDERSIVTVTSRMAGRIDRLFVDYTGVQVRAGDHLAEIYSPELLVAQRELISSKKSLFNSKLKRSSATYKARQSLYLAAKKKLRLLEFSTSQIEQIESSEKTSDRLTVYAPASGVVMKRFIKEGAYVKTGQALYSVADLSSVWVTLEAYEQDLPWLRYAQQVSFSTDAAPGEIFTGSIAFIDPLLNEMTRTAKVRVNVPNKKKRLKPGMFVRGTVQSTLANGGALVSAKLKGKWISPMHPEIMSDQPGKCSICGMDLVPAEKLGFGFPASPSQDPLVIPATAVLRTGSRAVVYKKIKSAGDLQFKGVEIELGARAGDYFVVKSGLESGDFVVSQGAFKIDSELQIRGKVSMMSMKASYAGPPIPMSPLEADQLDLFKAALNHFLKVTEHLAHDREVEANQEMKNLFVSSGKVGLLSLNKAILKIDKREGRKEINQVIPILTKAFGAIIRDRAANQLEPVYLLHCPMALDNAGGQWLSRNTKVENPYFGSEMFACGTLEAQLTVKSEVKEDHVKHNE